MRRMTEIEGGTVRNIWETSRNDIEIMEAVTDCKWENKG